MAPCCSAGEPAYGSIEGEWLCQPPYVVVHRLAVAQEMRRCGLATRFMREVETFARNVGLHSFRVDTNFDNRYMRSLLSALGFTYCGEIFYAHGSRRAYGKTVVKRGRFLYAGGVPGSFFPYIWINPFLRDISPVPHRIHPAKNEKLPLTT